MIKNISNWKLFSKHHMDDGNFNLEILSPHIPPFPGYIVNENHPFTTILVSAVDEKGNLTAKFSSSDNYETYRENLKKQPLDWKYRKKKIYYNVNSSGYRTYEWDKIDWKNAIVILGCSCTYGVGLGEDENISYHLERLTGRQVVNLGYPAGSNKLILDNSASLLRHFEMPYAVIINWTTTDRTRFYHEYGFENVGPWDANVKRNIVPKEESEFKVDMKKYWTDHFYNPTNELALNYYWSTYADAMFLNRTNYMKISVFPTTAHYTRSEKFFTFTNTARDLMHPGEETAIEIAEYIHMRLTEMDKK